MRHAPRTTNPPFRIPIILASASPRRAELLRQEGVCFDVMISPAPEPEHKPPAIPVDLWPMCLAYLKAAAVQARLKVLSSDAKAPIILGADTIVVEGQRILNKARDRAHARQILLSLSGKTHRVITGIALLRGEQIRLACASATCRMKKLSPAALNRYLDSGLWRGKAGAYGIQDAPPPPPAARDPFITLISGDITTVVGLPMSLVQTELASFAKD